MKVMTITSPDVNNGLGCRVTVWVAGCSHHCPGCHNPESWVYNQGKDIIEIIPILMEALNKPWIDGITFSGGDPLDQNEDSLKELYTLCKTIKRVLPEKNIWIWAGDVFETLIQNEKKKEILELCDVLVDGPYIQTQKNRHLAFRGSDNQRIIDLHKSFELNNVVELTIK